MGEMFCHLVFDVTYCSTSGDLGSVNVMRSLPARIPVLINRDSTNIDPRDVGLRWALQKYGLPAISSSQPKTPFAAARCQRLAGHLPLNRSGPSGETG